MSGPLAFPLTPEVWATHSDFHGMELRDWFAGRFAAAAIVAVAAQNGELDPAVVAKDSYTFADAMLAARQNGGSQ